MNITIKSECEVSTGSNISSRVQWGTQTIDWKEKQESNCIILFSFQLLFKGPQPEGWDWGNSLRIQSVTLWYHFKNFRWCKINCTLLQPKAWILPKISVDGNISVSRVICHHLPPPPTQHSTQNQHEGEQGVWCNKEDQQKSIFSHKEKSSERSNPIILLTVCCSTSTQPLTGCEVYAPFKTQHKLYFGCWQCDLNLRHVGFHICISCICPPTALH